MMMKHLLAAGFALLLLTLSSCSSVDKSSQSKRKKAPQYSAETQKSFEEIERDLLLERYKRMRIEDGIMQRRPGEPYRPSVRGTSPEDIEPPLARPGHKKLSPTPKKAVSPRPKPAPKAKKVLVNIEEQKREIEQNLTYFCMQQRTGNRFSNKTECQEFTLNLKSECLEKFDEGDRALTQCVKSRL